MIIYKYLLKKLITPFLFSVLTLTFIFLLQFLMRTADRLIGKGLDVFVITKLIVYNLSWMVVLIIPMAVLVTILMAFGSLTQDNEFAIIKSSGVSLIRLMIPVFILCSIICYLLIEFNNKVLPDANYANKLLMYEISRVKPTLSLESNIFSNEMNGYSILARKVSKKSNELWDLLIYDFRNNANITLITAKKGNLLFSKDNKRLIFILENGEIHQPSDISLKTYRRTFFKKHIISMDASQFSFEQSGPGAPRGDRELSANDMRRIVDSLHKQRDTINSQVLASIAASNNFIYNDNKNTIIESSLTPTDGEIIQSSIMQIRNILNNLNNEISRINYFNQESDTFLVEIYKKYSIPFSCIVFVFIGAPLGVLARKGSFGMAAGISLVFFLIYWACLIGGEKLADRQFVSPFVGMWIANIIMGIFGIFITYKMNKEQIILEFTFIKKLTPKFIKQFISSDSEN